MNDGEYTIYVLQWQSDRETSVWGNPNSKWVKCAGHYANDWFVCGKDAWGKAVDPHDNNASNLRYKNPKAHTDFDYVRQNTGYAGWRNLKFALAALKRVRELNKNGYNDSIDPGFDRVLMRRRRHKFRLVKIQITHKTEPLIEEEIVETLA